MALIILSIIPVIIFYLTCQKHIIKGVAACELGQKEEGLAALKKAKELGDERADKLIEKYEKK